MFNLRSSSIITFSVATISLATSLLLTGCGIAPAGSNGSQTGAAAPAAGSFGGKVHGGQQPVVGSTVVLWAAGTTGTYGTGATQIAKTTTAGDGSFTFDNGSGVSPCTTGQYLYITATGGNAGGGANNSLAMLTALPTPCSSTTGATVVYIDEVTTVAAVTALQQFISTAPYTPPYTGTGTVPWTIGAPSTNTVGLANAFSMIPLLASITTGTSAATFPANTITPNNSVTPQLFTTTVTPEISKINGLADVLSVCINDTTGNLCTGSQGVLTLSAITTGTTSVVPSDTIEAAYNMASLPNPHLNSTSGTSKYWTNSTSSTTYLSTLWSDITATAPFQPYLATTPTDTTVTLSWKCAGATSSTTGTVYAASVAIDANGYVWIGGGSGVTGNYVTQFLPSGQILQDVNTVSIPSYTLSFYADTTTPATGTTTANATQALGYGRPIWSIAIDTNNNAWFDSYGSTSPGTVATEATGVLAEITQPTVTPVTGVVTASGTATGYLVGSVNGPLVFDNSNNMFYDAQHGSGRYYLSMVSSASSYESDYEGIGRGSANYNGLAVDSNGYAWGFPTPSTCTVPDTVQRINAASMLTTTGTSATDVTLASTCDVQGAGDANGNMWSTDGVSLHYNNISASLTSPTITTAFTGGAGTGLLSVNGLAVDGAGNVWAINKGTATTAGSAGVAEFATNGTAGTATLLSPTGTSSAPLNGFGSTSGVYQGAPVQAVLDPSGNVWYATTAGSYLYVTVGIAAPTRTPLSAMYAHIGTKP
jgi:hypothetical protein